MQKITKGRVKVWFDVATYLYQKVAMLLMLIGVLRLNSVTWLHILIGTIVFIPLMLISVYLYMTYLYPEEQKYLDEKKPIQMEILKGVKDIQSKL